MAWITTTPGAGFLCICWQHTLDFRAGNFAVQKTNRPFSAIPIDQAYEQNNVAIEGDGCAVGLIDNPSAPRQWMVAKPDVSRLIEQFHGETAPRNRAQGTRDNGQFSKVAALKDVKSMGSVM